MILRADARHIPLADESVQCVVTSPPYWGLRDYGIDGQLGLEPTPELYVQHIVEVFREVKRVLRRDGTCWVNLGDSYAGSWGNYQPTGSGGQRAKETERWERGAYDDKPDWRPPTSNKLNGLKPKDLVGIPWRVAFALQADGWWLRSDIIWSKPNPMPESVTDRPTKSHEYIFLLAKSERYYYDGDAIREPVKFNSGLNFRAPSKHESNMHGGINGYKQNSKVFDEIRGANRRTVWEVATQPYPDAHFATYPEDLIKPCILAGSPVGSKVLDPFAGSGTTVKVAQDLGRVGIGLDLKPEYLKMAKVRAAQYGLAV